MRARRRRFSASLLGLLLMAAMSHGCVRTTSLGRAVAQSDGPVERDMADARDAGDDARTPATDARLDAALDMGPIVGGGRDASGNDSDSDADGPSDDAAAPMDAAVAP